MTNKVGVTLSHTYDNNKAVDPAGSVYHSERKTESARRNAKLDTPPITLYRHGLEAVDKNNSRELYGFF